MIYSWVFQRVSGNSFWGDIANIRVEYLQNYLWMFQSPLILQGIFLSMTCKPFTHPYKFFHFHINIHSSFIKLSSVSLISLIQFHDCVLPDLKKPHLSRKYCILLMFLFFWLLKWNHSVLHQAKYNYSGTVDYYVVMKLKRYWFTVLMCCFAPYSVELVWIQCFCIYVSFMGERSFFFLFIS